MLTVIKLTGNTKQVVDYYANKENYYFQQAGGDKLLSSKSIICLTDQKINTLQVHGRLASALGLTPGQTLSAQEFENILSARSARGKALCRKHKVTGIDLTFSAPKSASIAALVSDKDPAIMAAHEQAVLSTMRELEEYFAYAQPKPGENIRTGKMVYALATDGLSREYDPHLHTHVIVANLTERHTGKGTGFMALRMHEIFKDEFVKLGGALYRGHFAANYAKLGREVVYMKNGEWRDTAVSLEAEREFSKRHEQIAKAKGKGRNDKAAWETTRSAKDPGADINQIKKDWKQRFERLKTKTHKQNAEESIQARTDWATAAEFNEEAVQERQGMRGTADEVVKWQLAARRATDKTATASPQALATEYINERLREGAGPPVTYKEALIRLERQVKAGNLVKIEDRYTSWEMIAAEREYMDYAGTRLNQAAISAEAAGTFLAGYQSKAKKQGKKVLSDIQQTAVKQMIATNKTLSVVQGDAGAGKTTALHAAADYYQTRGVKVIGLAMQGAAAKNLEAETGIESVTLSSFLRRKTHEESRILIFDEASMLDSRNAAKLFKIAERNRDKIILVGDRNQLQSIGAGRVFERLVADCESAGDLISLNENFRQRNDALKKAVDLAKQGRMKDSLAALDSRGDITEIESTPARRSAIAGLYNKDTLIIAGTTAAKDELNSMIRARLAAAGALKQGVIYKLGRADKDGIEHERELTISKGEIITFTRNEYKNYDIRNGERAKVLECGEKSIIVETEDKRRLEINIEKYKGIDYGYALTTYKAQGQTYNSVVVESDTHIPTLVDMRNQYVNITRARDNVKIYTDDKEQLQELAEIRTYSRDTISCEHTFKAKERLAELNNRDRRDNTVKQIVVYNEAAVASTKDFLKSVPGDKWATEDLKKYETAMAQATQRLNELELSEEKKRAIADVLNNQKNAYIWNRPDMTTADEKIAAAQTYLKPKKENTSHHDSGRSFEREI